MITNERIGEKVSGKDSQEERTTELEVQERTISGKDSFDERTT